ncbi:MAG TPA: cupin domain-containing protein [Candidatus Saccharimonadales bacterium]|nr:cupin domain-containing protein [Candidatus Saccharimonadales bacterium]
MVDKKKDLLNLKKEVKVISAQEATAGMGPQNQLLSPTITNSMCGSEHISSGFLVMPPARVAKPHIHRHNELIIFFLEGWVICFIGRDYQPYYLAPGDFLYVPEGVIHFGINLSETERATAIEIRTDPHFNEDVELIPEMEAESIKVADEYRRKFAERTLDIPASWKDRSVGPYRHVETA